MNYPTITLVHVQFKPSDNVREIVKLISAENSILRKNDFDIISIYEVINTELHKYHNMVIECDEITKKILR